MFGKGSREGQVQVASQSVLYRGEVPAVPFVFAEMRRGLDVGDAWFQLGRDVRRVH